MPQEEIYQDELKNFTTKYNMPGFNLDAIADATHTLRYADTFLNGGAVANDPASQYIKWISKAASIHFEMNTRLNPEGKYMTSFDYNVFVRDFEKLAVAKYEFDSLKENLGDRKEYAGADPKDIRQAVFAQYKKVHKPLPTLWAEKLKEGDMKLEDLKTLSNNSFNAMDKKWYKDANEQAGNLKNVAAAYEAMVQLRASRSGVLGWLWKVIFNREQNKQEKAYLKTLEEQLETLRQDFPIDDVRKELTDKTVTGKDVKALEEARKAQTKKVEKTKKEAVAESKATTVKIAPVADKISQMADNDYISDIAKALIDELPGNGVTHFVRGLVYQNKLVDFTEKVYTMNDNFDKAVAAGGDPNKEMGKVVQGVFKETVEMFASSMVESDLEKAEGLKAAALYITNKLTAAAIYKDLGEAVKTHMDEAVKNYEEIVGAGKNYLEEIGKNEQALGENAISENDNEKVFNDDTLFADNTISKSPQVTSAPQHNVPTINNTNK